MISNPVELNRSKIKVNNDTILQDWRQGNIVVENKKQGGTELCQAQGQLFSCFELFPGEGGGWQT